MTIYEETKMDVATGVCKESREVSPADLYGYTFGENKEPKNREKGS